MARRDRDHLRAARAGLLEPRVDVGAGRERELELFARARGARLISVNPRYETLEDLFLRRVEAAGVREVNR